MSIKIERLDHFAIYVTELERSERFYSEYLGMRVRFRIGAEQVMLDCGGISLALFAKPDLRVPVEDGATDSPLGRVHFALRVSEEDWYKAQKDFAAAGIKMSKDIDWGDHNCFYIQDPDGNLIELMYWK
jgi:catechol 2,3-dioxygenase-like lactoylglutathione lyase family enzyme